MEIRGRGRMAQAVARVQAHARNALPRRAVEIVGNRSAGLLERLDDGVEYRVAHRHVADVEGPGGCPTLLPLAMMILDPAKHRLDIGPGPAVAAELAPALIILRQAAHIQHAVDRGGAAQ